MVNDPIGDMLIQIKNAVMANRHTVSLPYSKLKMAVARILQNEGYIEAVKKTGDDPKARLSMTIRYEEGRAVFSDVRRKSKPGLRVYIGKHEIPTVVGGMGIAILSTPLGVMTGKDAKKRGLGGEFLCEVW